MAKKLRWLLRFILRFLAGIVICITLYALAVFLLYHIPVNNHPEKGDIPVYISSNGVHTDIVVPLKNEVKDWSRDILFEHTVSGDNTASYVAFGWGDKGFYLNTPQWSDLKASTAFKAAFHLGTSAIHTKFYNELTENTDCRKILITEKDYADLVQYIENSFLYGTDSKVLHIKGYNYGRYDAFYEAEGSYSLFYTCNTWANNALKAAHQKAALWTPLDTGIFYQYK